MCSFSPPFSLSETEFYFTLWEREKKKNLVSEGKVERNTWHFSTASRFREICMHSFLALRKNSDWPEPFYRHWAYKYVRMCTIWEKVWKFYKHNYKLNIPQVSSQLSLRIGLLPFRLEPLLLLALDPGAEFPVKSRMQNISPPPFSLRRLLNNLQEADTLNWNWIHSFSSHHIRPELGS